MAKSTKKPSNKIVNRRAKFDYQLGDPLVVGLALTGAETRALRSGHGNLAGSYVTLLNGELFLLNAQIFGSGAAPIGDELRTRKLLAKASEIKKLIKMKEQGNTIIPMEVITSGRFIKLKIAPGKGKKKYDKREAIKRRDQELEAAKRARL